MLFRSGLFEKSKLLSFYIKRSICRVKNAQGISGIPVLFPCACSFFYERSGCSFCLKQAWIRIQYPCIFKKGLSCGSPHFLRQQGPGSLDSRVRGVLGSRPKQRPSLLGLSARTASRSERFEANRRRRLLGRDRAYARRSGRMRLTGEGSPGACCFGFQTKTTPFASRAFSPKRAYARRSGRMRLTGEGAVPPPRMPLPGKLGSPARSGTE